MRECDRSIEEFSFGFLSDASITSTFADPKEIRQGIEELKFQPFVNNKSMFFVFSLKYSVRFRFNPTDKRTEITYRQINDGTVHRISKGMSHTILDLCTREKNTEQIQRLNSDVDEFAERGLRSLAVAIEDVPDGTANGRGNGFKLIGLIPIYDPPREDTKETIERAIALGSEDRVALPKRSIGF